MKKSRITIGLVAALALIVGGLYAADVSYACGGCPAHAQKADAAQASGTNVNSDAGTATVQPADAKAAHAGCSGSADAIKASADKGSCASGAKATATKQCSDYKMKRAMASGELMTAEATLSKLSHCGIDLNSTDTETLAAMLAGHGCGEYTAAQWTTMIKAAKELDAPSAKVIKANATGDKACSKDACPMTKVAKDLAAAETTGSEKN